MIELDNTTSLDIDIVFLEKIASSLTQKDIELLITSKEQMHEINKTQRGIDSSTDVLSFPYEDMPLLGSIVISAWHVERIAEKLGHSKNDEIALLFIHALLHLLGYDHETDEFQMRCEEEKLVRKFNLPDSLIIRTEDK